jgi:hypothetical protein
MRFRVFSPKICARKCDFAFFLRRSAQGNAISRFSPEDLRKEMRFRVFSPKICARKCYFDFLSARPDLFSALMHSLPGARSDKYILRSSLSLYNFTLFQYLGWDKKNILLYNHLFIIIYDMK